MVQCVCEDECFAALQVLPETQGTGFTNSGRLEEVNTGFVDIDAALPL